MRSHSFQDTELKLYRYVNDSPGQVVEGVGDSKVLRRAQELRVKRSKDVNLTVRSHSFHGTALKLYMYVTDSP